MTRTSPQIICSLHTKFIQAFRRYGEIMYIQKSLYLLANQPITQSDVLEPHSPEKIPSYLCADAWSRNKINGC